MQIPIKVKGFGKQQKKFDERVLSYIKPGEYLTFDDIYERTHIDSMSEVETAISIQDSMKSGRLVVELKDEGEDKVYKYCLSQKHLLLSNLARMME